MTKPTAPALTRSLAVLAAFAGCSGGVAMHPGDSDSLGSSEDGGETGTSPTGPGTNTTSATTAMPGTEEGEAGSSDDGGSSSSGEPELPRECDDGIDNDGDGFADWQRDLGCWGPGDHTEAALSRDQEDGFTTFEIGADSVAIHVSNEGSDEADGLTPEAAVATLARAAELVRDGAHDFMLLRRGDVWRGQTLARFKSGLDAAHPLVIAGYGDSLELPRIEARANFIDHNGQGRSNVAIIGLHFVSHPGDPDDPEFDGAPGTMLRYIGGGANLLVEGCHFEYAELVVQSIDDNLAYTDIEIRRNVIERAYHADTCTPGDPNGNFEHRPSGIYASHVSRMTIEGNVLDHNGWNPDEVPSACATIYNHNLYLNGHDIVIRDNVLSRASSIHIKLRSDTPGEMTGTIIENNLFVEGEIGISGGGNTSEQYRFVDTQIIDNVITDIGRGEPTGRGLAWAIDITDNDGLDVLRNLVLNNRHPTLSNGFGLNIAGGSGRDYQIEDNLFWRLGGRAIRTYPAAGHTAITITENEVVDPDLAAALVDHRGSFSGYTYAGNRYYSSAPDADWFALGNQGEVDIGGWQDVSGEADASAIALPDYEDRDVEGYALSIGAGSTLADLIGEARLQNRLTWRDELTAPAINAWIREGFDRSSP